MKKYCKRCRHYSEIIGAILGKSELCGLCWAPELVLDIFVNCRNKVIPSFCPEETNKNNNCKYYKRNWLKWKMK